MSTDIVLLDPGDQAVVDLDWSETLSGAVTLVAVVHTLPAPLTKLSEATNTTTGHSQVKVSGAVHGSLYLLSASATLSNGEVINRQVPARGWDN
jgi:hypothetical protein